MKKQAEDRAADQSARIALGGGEEMIRRAPVVQQQPQAADVAAVSATTTTMERPRFMTTKAEKIDNQAPLPVAATAVAEKAPVVHAAQQDV